jgi:sugar lactone lactonase YvrE
MPAVACTPSGEGEPEPAEGEGEEPAFTSDAAAVDLVLPWDATPSPDGSVIYYTAKGSDGETHSLWRVAFDGSGTPEELVTSLVAPLGLAISTDGATVFVGDAGDEDGALEEKSGAIFAVTTADGALSRITATDGFSVKGLEVTDEDGTDVVTFTGSDPADGAPGVFRLVDGAVTLVAKGEPFADPSGVTVKSDGAIYVVDTKAGDDGLGTLVKVVDGTATTITRGLRAGMPAGISLNLDESAVFLSTLTIDNQALVTVVDPTTGEVVGTVNSGLEGNDEAGGLHRAKGSEAYAWAGTRAVYAITFQ